VEHGADTAAFFARLSHDLVDAEERVILQRIAEGAVDAVQGCDASALALYRRRGDVSTEVATSSRITELLARQRELDEGPDGGGADGLQLVPDVRADTRWPRWARHAGDAGVGSALAVRLDGGPEQLGTLHLYAAHPQAFSPEAVDRARVFALQAAATVGSARLVNGLRTAVQSRHLIGIAQGILMQRYELDVDASFEVLRRYSSHANIKLRDVAQLVVDQGLLPRSSTDLDG
jgi:hypothetical protein